MEESKDLFEEVHEINNKIQEKYKEFFKNIDKFSDELRELRQKRTIILIGITGQNCKKAWGSLTPATQKCLEGLRRTINDIYYGVPDEGREYFRIMCDNYNKKWKKENEKTE